MKGYPKSLSRLVEELEKLPGIGTKTDERLAFHILKAQADEAMICLGGAFIHLR